MFVITEKCRKTQKKTSCCTRNNVTKSLADPKTYQNFDQIDRCRADSTQLQKAQKYHGSVSVRFVITENSGKTQKNELSY